MSYVAFAKNIVVPYKVNIANWPSDVPRSYPQKLTAEETKTLYEAWNTGGAHWYRMTADEHRKYEKEAQKNGELDPKPRQKRSDAGGTHKSRTGVDSESE